MKTWHHVAIGAALIGSAVLVANLPTHRSGPPYYYPPTDITGVTNPNVTQANIQQTICVSGWTATIRPPSNYTTTLKKKQEAQYGLATTTGEEEDHFISLELGGNPTDPHNLWPESYPVAHLKDQAENALKSAVCAGQLSLAEAQDIITGDWYAYYQTLGPSFGSTGVADPDDE
jgi:hypothetical protein